MNPLKSSGRLNPMHRHNTSGLFSGKGPPIFHDFPGEAQGGGPGEPKAIQRGPREPKRAPGEPKGSPMGGGGKVNRPKLDTVNDSLHHTTHELISEMSSIV